MTKKIEHLTEDEWLQLVRQTVAMPDAPQEWVQSALSLWQQSGSTAGHAPPLRRWVASLRFDSWALAPASAGMRSLPSQSRHLLFAAEDLDIDVRIAPRAEHFVISGQVLGRDVADGQVELRSLAAVEGSTGQLRAPIIAPGEFNIERVPAGTWLITIRADADELVLTPIQVGAPRDAARP